MIYTHAYTIYPNPSTQQDKKYKYPPDRTRGGDYDKLS